MAMTRTTVYLSQDAKRRLSAAARRRHRSEVELIRDAIDQLLADEPERPRPIEIGQRTWRVGEEDKDGDAESTTAKGAIQEPQEAVQIGFIFHNSFILSPEIIL